jgi:hypothetical protein
MSDWQWMLPLSPKRGSDAWYYSPSLGIKRSAPHSSVPLLSDKEMLNRFGVNKLKVKRYKPSGHGGSWRLIPAVAPGGSMGSATYLALGRLGVIEGFRAPESREMASGLGSAEPMYQDKKRACRHCGVMGFHYFYCTDCQKGVRRRSVDPIFTYEEARRMSAILESGGA